MIITQTTGPQSGSLFPIGNSTITYEVTLVCNGQTIVETCSFNVKIEAVDVEIEVSINCPADINSVTSNQSGTIITFDQPTVTTNCANETITIAQTSGPSSGSIFPIGNSTITFDIILGCDGEMSLQNCSFAVNVVFEEEEDEECTETLTGFTLLGQFEDASYFISNNSETWTTASDIAAANGGSLASYSDATENEFVRSRIGNNIVFIGLFQAANGVLGWDSGEAFTFDFVENAPNDQASFGNMNFWSGGWSFDSEFVERRFIVEVACGPATPTLSVACPENQTVLAEDMNGIVLTYTDPLATTTCPEGSILNSQIEGPASGSLFEVGSTTTISYEIVDACNNVENCTFTVTINGPSVGSCPTEIDGFTMLGEFEGHKYFSSNESATWEKAAEVANEHGGYLVSINDANENEFIRQNISEISYIGLNDAINEGHWNGIQESHLDLVF